MLPQLEDVDRIEVTAYDNGITRWLDKSGVTGYVLQVWLGDTGKASNVTYRVELQMFASIVLQISIATSNPKTVKALLR